MCGPMIGPALAIAGAGMSAASSVMGGAAQKQMADYQAKVAKINANAAIAEGFAQSGMTRDQYQEVASKQRANLAKAGVRLDSGSAVALAFETQRREEVAAAVDIWKGRSEATKFRNAAAGFKAEGKAAQTAGIMQGATSLIRGVASVPGIGQGRALRLNQGAG